MGIPLDLHFSASGSLLATPNAQMREYDADTGAQLPFALSGGPTTGGFFTFGPDGDLYVSTQGWVNRYSAAGVFKYQFATGLSMIGGGQGSGSIHFGPDGHLYAANTYSSLVKFNGTTGSPISTWPMNVGDFAFVAVPEPGALGGFFAAALWVKRRRRR